MALRIKEPKAGDWDYDGMCRPGSNWSNNANSQLTFSVGIFQWAAKASGKGVKRTAVVKRVSGYCNNPQDVYDRAEKYIVENLEGNNG